MHMLKVLKWGEVTHPLIVSAAFLTSFKLYLPSHDPRKEVEREHNTLTTFILFKQPSLLPFNQCKG